MKQIDIVVPYVNCFDPEWLKIASKYTSFIPLNRVRDLGTLKYFFRGVETNMPWIRNVYLVVQMESQIPKWLNVTHPKLKIIFHKDYIPSKYLPTFNSNVIELYYHKIPGLSKQFILANDDMIAIKPLIPENFFNNGHIVYGPMEKCDNWYPPYPRTSYVNTLYNNAIATGIITRRRNRPLYPNYHLFMPHLKSVYKLCWSRYGSGIRNSFKYWHTRNHNNLTHFLFNQVAAELNLIDYDNTYRAGLLNIKDGASANQLIDALELNQSKMCCLNDDFVRTDITECYRIICTTLHYFLPNVCEYEILS